jgi:hypothetical protein
MMTMLAMMGVGNGKRTKPNLRTIPDYAYTTNPSLEPLENL